MPGWEGDSERGEGNLPSALYGMFLLITSLFWEDIECSMVNKPNNVILGTNETQCKALNQKLSSEFPKIRKN